MTTRERRPDLWDGYKETRESREALVRGIADALGATAIFHDEDYQCSYSRIKMPQRPDVLLGVGFPYSRKSDKCHIFLGQVGLPSQSEVGFTGDLSMSASTHRKPADIARDIERRILKNCITFLEQVEVFKKMKAEEADEKERAIRAVEDLMNFVRSDKGTKARRYGNAVIGYFGEGGRVELRVSHPDSIYVSDFPVLDLEQAGELISLLKSWKDAEGS
jgi:hypothetical protein